MFSRRSDSLPLGSGYGLWFRLSTVQLLSALTILNRPAICVARVSIHRRSKGRRDFWIYSHCLEHVPAGSGILGSLGRIRFCSFLHLRAISLRGFLGPGSRQRILGHGFLSAHFLDHLSAHKRPKNQMDPIRLPLRSRPHAFSQSHAHDLHPRSYSLVPFLSCKV